MSCNHRTHVNFEYQGRVYSLGEPIAIWPDGTVTYPWRLTPTQRDLHPCSYRPKPLTIDGHAYRRRTKGRAS